LVERKGPVKNLGRATLRALASNAAGNVAKGVLQFVYTVILARLLGPEPFGLAAAAWTVIGLPLLVGSFGFGAALVQRQEISEDDTRYAVTMQTLLGVIAAAALIALAEPIAGAFKSLELVPVIHLMAPIVVLTAMAGVPLSLLRRDLRFGQLQIVHVGSSMVAFLFVGIPLAFAGLGVWSLVWAYLSQSFFELALSYHFTRHSVVPKFKLPDRSLFNFSTIVFFINLFNYATLRAENLIVGRYYGMGDLGAYNRAQTLVSIAANQIVGTYQPVLFSMYSRAQDRREMIAMVYLNFLSLISLTVLPVFLVIAILSEVVIIGLFGDAWLGAIPLLVPLALTQAIQVVAGTVGPILWATGRPGKELQISALTFAVLVVILGFLSQVSLLAIAWGMFTVHTFRCVVMTRAIRNLFSLHLHQFYRATRGGLLMSLACGLVALGVDRFLADRNVLLYVRLALDLGLVSLVYVLLLVSRPMLFIGPYTADLYRQFSHLLPDKLQFVARLLRLPVD
jgi:O-antigen/teichoic acid export membrane protein